MVSLQSRVLSLVLLVGDGELGPGVEELVGLGARTALEASLDAPGEIGAAVALEDDVDALCIEVFGVKEEAVHVEEAGADGREAVREPG
jgi:hypothetical protein